jgi:Uncharacterized enzyme of heme biosynthesis
MSASSPDRPSPRRRRRWLAGLGWLLFVLLLAAVLGGGWQLYGMWKARRTQQQQVVAQLRQQIENGISAGAKARGEARKQMDQTRARLQQLDDLLQNLATSQTQLKATVEGGAEALRLGAIEQLLAQANDRLLLGRDVATALLALRMADSRLAQIGDPRYLPVRKAIAAEQAQLESVTLPDVPGVSLRLVTLAQAAEQLPLRAPNSRVASPAPPPTQPAAPEERGFWQRIGHAVAHAFAEVFRVRRVDDRMPPLVQPQEKRLVRLILAARLEGAQDALLAGDGASFRAQIQAADTWLAHYYDGDDRRVQTAIQRLDGMQQIHLNPELPDISQSLSLLRKLRRGGG